MTRPGLMVLAAAALAAASPALEAQGPVRIRTASYYESYSFDPGLPFTKVSEIAVPLAVDVTFGRYASLTLSSGFVAIDLTSANTAALPDQNLSGALDTELRLGVNVIPGRLVMLVSGAVPTGIKSVDQQDVSILGALASDVIGFAVSSVGSGGTVGGGLVAALPVGRFALGLGVTYTYPFAYQPVVGTTTEIRPGGEVRGRAGLEGPLGRTTYLRVATVTALRGKDQFGGTTQWGVGTRFIGYLELAQGFGNTQLSVYGFDVYRGSPQFVATPVGPALLPKGNLMVGGLRFSLPVTRRLTLVPRTEFRYSSQSLGEASDTDGDGLVDTYVEGPMEKAGTSLRFGVDVRQRLANAVALVANGGFLTGNVTQAGTGTDIGLSGYRFGLLLDITP